MSDIAGTVVVEVGAGARIGILVATLSTSVAQDEEDRGRDA